MGDASAGFVERSQTWWAAPDPATLGTLLGPDVVLLQPVLPRTVGLRREQRRQVVVQPASGIGMPRRLGEAHRPVPALGDDGRPDVASPPGIEVAWRARRTSSQPRRSDSR